MLYYLFFEKVWTFFKNNWKTTIIALASGIGLIVVTSWITNCSETSKYDNRLMELTTSHTTEIAKINAAIEEERAQHLANVAKLNDDLSKIQQQYDQSKKDLEIKKDKIVVDLVKKFDGKPDKMADELSKLTGFKVVVPEDK